MRQPVDQRDPLTGDAAAADPPDAEGLDADATVAADALPKDAAKAVRRIMREKGLTQIDLHKRLGVTEATVSRWLSRRQGMPLSTIKRLCDALEVPLSAILVPGAPTEGDPVGLLRLYTEQQQRWTEWLERATAWRDETGDRLRRMEELQERLRATQDELRTALRRVPLYQQNHRGDPRLGEGDPNAALPVAYAQLPPGATTRTVGQRGFALLLNNAVVAGLGVRRGDVVYVNPDAAYTAGSLVAIGADWPEGPEGPAPRHGQPRAITLRVLAYGMGAHQGALVARTALEPPLTQIEELAPETFVVYGPVVIHQGLTFLPEGRGVPGEIRRGRPADPPGPPPPAAPEGGKGYTIGPDGRPINFLQETPPPPPPPDEPPGDPLGESDEGAARVRP